MNDPGTDILMITYNRPHYTQMTLAQLLATCDESMRVWLWHNGGEGETLDVVRALASHPRVHELHVSPDNKKLVEPTNWLWKNAKGAYLSKVDDDCLLPMGWAQTLRTAHQDVPELGVVGCFRYRDEDLVQSLVERKLRSFGKHRIFVNCWVQGSGYLMKRGCVDAIGPLGKITSFTRYCIELALNGWINGFYYPFMREDHMDDPRSPNTALRTDEDFRKFMPLTAKNYTVMTLKDWEHRVRKNVRSIQESPVDPSWLVGWRSRARGAALRLRRLFVR